MFDFRLKVFQSVAQNRSFTKASKELFISQPAISKHIQELEIQYKAPLFERSGHRIDLTAAGELLLVHADKILADYRKLEFEMNLLTRHHSGTLALGASTTIAQYILPPMLSSFLQKFPGIRISLINGNSVAIEQAVTDGRISLGLVEGNTRQHSLQYTPFMKDELVVVTHLNGSLAKFDEITLEQLCSLPLVLRENGSGTLEVFEAALALHHVKLAALNVVIQLGSTESIKLFLENYDCLAVASVRAVSKELAAGVLKVIDVAGFQPERVFSFVEKRGQSGGLEESFIRFAQMNSD